MSFEELFPSLKTRWDEKTKKGIFYREEIQENCFDKQRVLETLDKWLIEETGDKDLDHSFSFAKEHILKELRGEIKWK